MSIASQINLFVEQMSEKNQEVLLELVKVMLSTDDILTDEDIADIKQARLDYANGEAVPHSAIIWD